MTEAEISQLLRRVADFQVASFIGFCHIHGCAIRDESCSDCHAAQDLRERYFTETLARVEAGEQAVVRRHLASLLAAYLHDGEDPIECLGERLRELQALRKECYRHAEQEGA